MIPATKNGHPSLLLLSAMQKCIRRGLEADAMGFAVELIHTSKPFTTMVCNRLEVISHEDIDSLAAPWVIPYVATAMAQAKAWYDPKKIGKVRMPVGNAIRLMCRAPKSREGDHFQAAVGLANLLEGTVPKVPDWAYDQHTSQGKRMGRGLDHFRTEGTMLFPPPEQADPYEEEAYRLWELKKRSSLVEDENEE